MALALSPKRLVRSRLVLLGSRTRISCRNRSTSSRRMLAISSRRIPDSSAMAACARSRLLPRRSKSDHMRSSCAWLYGLARRLDLRLRCMELTTGFGICLVPVASSQSKSILTCEISYSKSRIPVSLPHFAYSDMVSGLTSSRELIPTSLRKPRKVATACSCVDTEDPWYRSNTDVVR